MSTSAEIAVEIHPLQFDVPEDELNELGQRITATRWPSKKLVGDRSQGVWLATIQEVVDSGGHFAAWEEPELFSTEARAASRSLRYVSGTESHA